MHDTLHYRCPRCDAAIDIDPGVLGRTSECPACGQPISFEVEEARPADAPAEGATVHHIAQDDSSTDEYEAEIERRHPAPFRDRPLHWLLGLVVAAAGIALAVGTWEREEPILRFIGLGLAAAGLLYLLLQWLRTRFTLLRVTNVRTVYREGIIARHTSEVRHVDVRNVKVDQTAVQRVLGIGSIAISSAGQDDLEIIARGIPRPGEIVEVVRSHQVPN